MRFNDILFRNREEAGLSLAERLTSLPLTNPLVLAIPRGGIEVAAPIARQLGAELDVVLSRKLRAPAQPELAIGAISESGEVYLNDVGDDLLQFDHAYVDRERLHQLAEIERRKSLFRSIKPGAAVIGRSVIVTDDGIATGSTMIAALHTVRAAGAKEIIVAVPVATTERLRAVRELSDQVICLHEPREFLAIGQFYDDFEPVSDERVAGLLRESSLRSHGSQ